MLSEDVVRKERVLQRLAAFYVTCEEHRDRERMRKVELLARKVEEGQLIVAFSGHFSAGKSTMINALIGEPLLPSSPIPTSANLIAVQHSEEEKMVVTMASGKRYVWSEPLETEHIQALGRNGDEVARLDVFKRDSELPDGVIVLDTPGIDSVDDAHKRSTESAIHLADVVFYVMDYNHVQSQLNFVTIRELMKHGVRIRAIVNQIDKHREEELPFSVFQSSTVQAFKAWNALPERFYYTTLVKELPGNDFPEIREFIASLLDGKDEHILASAEAAYELLYEEHLKYIEEEFDDMRSTYEEVVTDAELADPDPVFEEEKRSADSGGETAFDRLQSERDKTVKSANLMPPPVRQAAEEYLVSCQPSFKVGFLQAKRKTEEERKRRFDSFYALISEQKTKQLEWHIKQLLHSFMKEQSITDRQWSDRIDQFIIPFPETAVTEAVRSGAEVNAQSLLNYTNDVAERLRTSAKKASETLILELYRAFEDHVEEVETDRTVRSQTIRKKAGALRQLIQQQKQISGLAGSLEKNIAEADAVIKKWNEKWSKPVETVSITELTALSDKKPQHRPVEETAGKEEVSTYDEVQVRRKMKEVASAVAPIKGFERQAEQLLQQARKMENKSFTVALFGAFSAGKSSFANALLGENVLPVSPNPTTAAINRIKPPEEQSPHGTVRVYFKTEKAMLDDLNQAFASFDYHASSLIDAAEAVSRLPLKTADAEMHRSFLLAFEKGYGDYGHYLGNELMTDQDAFKGFVANEHQSCFVESIDLFYASSLAKAGVTLVDTPGADSINARHTDLSFNYIRSSDAVLFVTYFNHAFARADREFLIQLGRVKESFELDKMFFIVNAVDLASNEEEKQQVLQYVAEQLQTFSINRPKLFGVSSLQALKRETEQQSGIVPFKDSFESFLEQDLFGMVLQSGELQWRATYNRLVHLHQEAAMDAEKKEQLDRDLAALSEQVRQRFSEGPPQTLVRQTHQEVEELLHYMQQRVMYRYSDFFKEAIHPSDFVHQSPQTALQKGMDAIIKMTGFDLAQEQRVLVHRMLLFVQKQVSAHAAQLVDEKTRTQFGIEFPAQSVREKEFPAVPSWLSERSAGDFQAEKKLFTSTKRFFEKNEKQKMKDAIEEKLRTFIVEEAGAVQQELIQWITEWFSDKIVSYYHVTMENYLEQIDGARSALTGATADDIAKALLTLEETVR